MSYKIGAEMWVKERDAFLFRCRAPNPERLWTFFVPRSALTALMPGSSHFEAFEAHRPDIYQAAVARMCRANPREQLPLTVEEIQASKHSTLVPR